MNSSQRRKARRARMRTELQAVAALRTLNDPHAQTQALLRGQARYERSLGIKDTPA